MSTTMEKPHTLIPGPEAVAELSGWHGEPEWMLAARQAAWAQYEAMPWPHSKEEAWRRAPLGRYPLDRTRLSLVEPADATAWRMRLALEEQVGGTLVHVDGTRVYQCLRPELAQQGVVLADLHQALQTHGELIRSHWLQGSIARGDFNRFTALHAAMWHGGTFLYVPAGVKVALPLQALVGYSANGGTGMHHTMVIAEANSRVTLYQDRVSFEREPELNAEMVEIYAAENAWVRYVSLQHWGPARWTVGVQNASLKAGAHLNWVNGSLGGQGTKEFLRSDLLGPEAWVQMQGIALGDGTRWLDQSTYQHHQAPNTHSELGFRNVLRDRSRTVFYGMIRVEPEALKSEGYQSSHNLLLDEGHADAIPGLEILANDVRCSHGATVSRPDPEQTFYLQSRGLDESAALQLLVQGFLTPVIDQIPLAHTRDRLTEELEERIQSR